MKSDPDRLTIPELIVDLLKDPDRKSISRIGWELIFLSVMHRKVPTFYFSRYLFKKGRNNIRDYYPESFFDRIKLLLNDKEARDVLENKLYFDLFYRHSGISLPRILMFNHRKVFFIDNSFIEINTAEEFKGLLKKVIISPDSDGTLFIKKTFWSYGGHQIYKINAGQIDSDPELMGQLYDEVTSSGFLYQETVQQHPELNRLNSSCLNTIRFDTYIDDSGNIGIMSGYLRTSIMNRHVDNINSGGCKVIVDMDSGRLKTHGYRSVKRAGSKLLTSHPVSGVVFENFTIPCFTEAIALVKKAAGLMPCLRLVGWDVAIGANGPVLIEGNSDYTAAGNDMAAGGYRSVTLFRQMLCEVKAMDA